MTTTPGSTSPTLFEQWCGFFYFPQEPDKCKFCETGPTVFSSLSEKTRKSNRLQMALQRQYFLLSYLKTLSVGPAGVRTRDLPLSKPALSQLSQPGGGFCLSCPSATFALHHSGFVPLEWLAFKGLFKVALQYHHHHASSVWYLNIQYLFTTVHCKPPCYSISTVLVQY